MRRASQTKPAASAQAQKYGFEDDEDAEIEAEEAGNDLRAWEREYENDRSWEAIVEDESGLLRPLDVTAAQRERRRRQLEAPAARVRRGMIRFLYLIVDFSNSAAEVDFKPSRMAVVANVVELFVREFFDQNPLSHLGIIVIRNGLANRLTELSGSPEAHIAALRSNMECSGDASIQNALEAARGSLSVIPSYGHREVLLLCSSLCTVDPGDIMETLEQCKKAKIRCSIIGLSAEVYICRLLCEKTGGLYAVALTEQHLRDLVLDHSPPPPALAETASANLVRMGFPQRQAEMSAAICSCHRELRLGGGYSCPRCKCRVCDLPTECPICNLTLVSSPHLARSYHHLFPVPPFEEVSGIDSTSASANVGGAGGLHAACFACQQPLPVSGSSEGVRLMCTRCKQHFCFDCDFYIHESLHNCPGCECSPLTSSSSSSSVSGNPSGQADDQRQH
ncbi:hypothetical protein CBR_g21234 [Chara braunii]|uniref:General transcription factor IIH subunit n=1 Tax=Chara braunii TaxID=69332 RepID=A0A388L1A5_CHABU|nr:hypothetical protein CBR_g21234 [Chara braunii]|eukprot:GBG75993.1 hypothetical protein CBR_g21234 [Chara braunii]